MTPTELQKDVQRYWEISKAMSKMIEDAGGFRSMIERPSSEFNELWKESETIKNRHGGHVPVSKQNSEKS